MHKSRPQTFDPVGRCIYCDATGVKLTEEHIIPKGMRGTLRLPDASCERCACKTSLFEGVCQRNMFPTARAMWGLYGRRNRGVKRKRSGRPTAFPVLLDGRDELVGLSEYPFSIMLPLLDRPGIFAGRSPDAGFPDFTPDERTWRWFDAQAPARAERILQHRKAREIKVVHEIPYTAFCKLIAKVGHSLAAAHRCEFEPWLRKIILSPRSDPIEEAPYLIGLASEDTVARFTEEPIPNDAFRIGLMDVPSDNPDLTLLSALIQVFCNVNAPVYEVVVGRLKQPFKGR